MLRWASLKWKPRNEAKTASRTERKINPKTGRLAWHSLCNICKKDFPEGSMILDHILPVVPVSGWVDWENYLDRMFCEQSNFQTLCETCDIKKCADEGQIRKVKRKKKSKKIKKKG